MAGKSNNERAASDLKRAYEGLTLALKGIKRANSTMEAELDRLTLLSMSPGVFDDYEAIVVLRTLLQVYVESMIKMRKDIGGMATALEE